MKNNITELLSEFDNGIELYQNSAIFHNCVEHIHRGGNVFKILEQVVVMFEDLNKKHSELIASGKIRQEIIVSKKEFDKLLNK
jgi:hypothetical protein